MISYYDKIFTRKLIVFFVTDGGQICDLAYEMFDCVSDKIDQVREFFKFLKRFQLMDTFSPM